MTIVYYPKFSTTADDATSTVQPLLVSAMLEDCAGEDMRTRGIRKKEEQVGEKKQLRKKGKKEERGK